MPTEAELRRILHDGEPERGAIDVDAVVRRARARRRPKQLAAALGSAFGVLAAVAVSIPVLLSAGVPSQTLADAPAAEDAAALGAADENEGRYTTESAQGSLDRMLICGQPPAAAVSEVDGLGLGVTASTSGASGTVLVRISLTNDGDVRVRGTLTAPPTVTLAESGAVVSHGETEATPTTSIDLAPGETLTFSARYAPVACGGDESGALAPGRYDLTTAIGVVEAGGTTRLLVSPATTVVLR